MKPISEIIKRMEARKMKPQEVSIELKLTKEITDDVWRGLTLGAKAILEPGETLAEGSERLYEELAAEFKALWHREDKPPVPPIAPPPTPPEEDALMKAALEMGGEPEEDPSYCHIHETGMVLRKKDGQTWFSHKLEDGSFCKGVPPKEKPDPSYCPIHKVKMDLREKAGKSWYSHKVGGGWCKGMAAKKEQG